MRCAKVPTRRRHMLDEKSGRTTYGVGISSNITRASLRGIFSAVNRLFY